MKSGFQTLRLERRSDKDREDSSESRHQHDPQTWRAFERAALATSMGKWDTALTLLKDCLNDEPDQPEFLSLHGYCLARSAGSLVQAWRECHQAVALRPGDARFQARLGHVLRLRRDFTQARQHLEIALQLDRNLELAAAEMRLLRLHHGTWWQRLLRFVRDGAKANPGPN